MNAPIWWAASRCYSVTPNDDQAELLLGRKPNQIPLVSLQANLQGSTVLVTGAGGFIGSEICREAATLGARIVAVDNNEYGLANLAETSPASPFALELLDIRDRVRVHYILNLHRPSHVYHAAAYKHVPFLEAFPVEAVENNTLATWRFAQACSASGVERFVFVSSDKAASASNVLGMSKRLAEILVSTMPASSTNFTSVRCANVLGSPGSVLPRAIDQLSRGLPVTLTSRSATRYFITLHEAAQAILYASHLAEPGAIFVPDAGEPLRVVDLLTRLGGPIEFEVVGLRPGDQEDELLFSAKEKAELTVCRRMRVISSAYGLEQTQRDRLVNQLLAYSQNRDGPGLRSYVHSFLLDFV